MANASPHLQYSIIRRSSCFVVKRQCLLATREPNNVSGKNSFKYNGLVHEKTIGIENGPDNKSVVLVTKNKKNRNKPNKSHTRVTLSTRNPRKVFKTIMALTKKSKYRRDINLMALRKASALMKVQKRMNNPSSA